VLKNDNPKTKNQLHLGKREFARASRFFES